MTPQDFIAKWRAVELKERSASQSHFMDLCRLLGVDDPTTADNSGAWYTFEKGTGKASGGEGWADVWRKDCFAWEYKGKRRDLNAAFTQLQQYKGSLGNPPLLIVSDMDTIVIHTDWTGFVSTQHTLTLDDLLDAGKRDLLRACFDNPDRLKPDKTRQALTEEAAEKFAAIADRLRQRGHEAQGVAHFVNRLVFCMFAEDVDLLPDRYFSKMIDRCTGRNDHLFAGYAAKLFAAMRVGGEVGFDRIEWFNGGLFDSDDALPLTYQDIDDLKRAAHLDWSDIDPSIMGTLFERGLDPDKRSQLGAHYTDRGKIMQIVTPVIDAPLRAEWTGVLSKVDALLAGGAKNAKAKAEALHAGFVDRLTAFRILDPACGSGNFLSIALQVLKQIEHEANLACFERGLQKVALQTGPENMLGIELNPYAAELARVSVWIGDIQWSRRNGIEPARNPILRSLNTIENRDAVLGPDGGRAEWPRADVVVGNPPFLGGKKVLSELGKEYVVALRNAYKGTLPNFSDLVCYWFAQAWQQMTSGKLQRAGLVSTNSIRGGSNREALHPIVDEGQIFEAWSDEEWTVDGAAVRVSLVCFSKHGGEPAQLDGRQVSRIFADLTANQVDLTKSATLEANSGCAFIGVQKTGPFDVDGELARNWLKAPLNPNGRPNADVLKHYVNGIEVVRRPQDTWIIDFGPDTTETQAAHYEAPFQFALLTIFPVRQANSEEVARRLWWRYWRPRPEFYTASANCSRIIITPRVSKHRLFVWRHNRVLPDSAVVAIARDDDTTFGILHSRFHELWALRMGTFLGVGNDPRYTPSTTFETFPFPEGLTPDIPAQTYADDPRAKAIAVAAARLNELRENWLNPPDLVVRVPEVVPGYPDRLLPVDGKAAAILKTRTLTQLYNARPAWLGHAHEALDRAVAAAYGWADWQPGMAEDEILARLFRLNQKRAGKG